MPFANFTTVREVSSEDNVHLAENLIKIQPGKKWKTKNAGEKSAYVILEMSESNQITGIDIGNEHSAFIEVLVGKSSTPEDFKEILITCSFMTPTESKSSNNTNRVRCFNREALVPSIADSKWSLVKIVCTQPFNKHVPYGLSFIKVHINDNENKNSLIIKKNLVPDQFVDKTTNVISQLKYREDSPDLESENSSSLFDRWKKSKDNIVEPTTAAAIRIASQNFATLVPRRISDVEKPKTSQFVKMDDNILDRNRDILLFGDEIDDTNNEKTKKLERLSQQIDVDKERRRVERESEISKRKSLNITKSFKTTKNVDDKLIKPSCSKISSNEPVKKRPKSPPENPMKKMKTLLKFIPFNQLLKGVVLVISGIQNPDREILRNKAIALGAKYKADWDSTCTHLICAFKNTPKYNQVRGKGKVVTRSWIEKCYSLKKYLPWRRYALDSIELSKTESDEEILDDTLKSQTDEKSNDTSLRKSLELSEDSNYILPLYNIDNQPSGSSSESDTDDEIKRVKQKTIDMKQLSSKTLNIFEVSTDEEDYINEKINQNK